MSLIDITYFYGDISIAQKDAPGVESELQWFIDEYEPQLLEGLLGSRLYRAFLTGLQAGTVDQKWLNILYGYYEDGLKLEGLLPTVQGIVPGTYYPSDIEVIITGSLIGATTYTNSFLSGKDFRVVQRGIGNLGSDVTLNDDGFTLNAGIFAVNDRYYIEFTSPVPLPTSTVVPGSAKLSMIANYVFYYYSQSLRTVPTGTGEKVLMAQLAVNASAVSKETLAWNKMAASAMSLATFLRAKSSIYDFDMYGFKPELLCYKNSLGL